MLYPSELTIISDFPFRRDIRCDLKYCGCRVNSFIWISHSLKTIYFETPKAACSSVKRILDIKINANNYARAIAKLIKRNYHYDLKIRRMFPISFVKKRLLSNLIRHELFNIENTQRCIYTSNSKYNFVMFDGSADEALEAFPDYFSFTIVRNPYHRIKSAYKMFCADNRPVRNRQIETLFKLSLDKLDFQTFAAKALHISNHHWLPYHYFLPKNKKLDFIAKVETLQNDWRFIARQVNIDSDLPKTNVTNRSDVELDCKTYDSIMNFYKHDCALFQYKA